MPGCRDYEFGDLIRGQRMMSCGVGRHFRSDLALPIASIIAMKGPPLTRKTEFATLIADSLGCPILSLEHFLDELQYPWWSPEREDEAFRVICRMAHQHLSRASSKAVVIDSPLSSPWHLHQLTTVASSLSSKRARVVIIECKPMNVYLWKMELEQRLARHPPLPCEWYKPRNREDVDRIVQFNGVYYDERSVPRHELVSRLVLDPFVDHPLENSTRALFCIPPATTRFIDAVQYMITRGKGDGPDVVVYQKWQHQSRLLSYPSPVGKQVDNQSVYCSSHGHNIIVASRLEHEECAYNCTACQKKVTRSDAAVSYNCKGCSLALHKECAESFDTNNTWESVLPNNPDCSRPRYEFPETFACKPCRGRGKGFFDNCGSCLFETHLRCRLMPTVIRHSDTEEHLLTIVLLPVATAATEVYRCVACGVSDRIYMYLCKICGDAYHYKCLNLPRRVEHVHGGHHHHLSLTFSSEEAEEDYICDECQELRDPMLWFYSCEDCPYELHPSCVGKKS